MIIHAKTTILLLYYLLQRNAGMRLNSLQPGSLITKLNLSIFNQLHFQITKTRSDKFWVPVFLTISGNRISCRINCFFMHPCHRFKQICSELRHNPFSFQNRKTIIQKNQIPEYFCPNRTLLKEKPVKLTDVSGRQQAVTNLSIKIASIFAGFLKSCFGKSAERLPFYSQSLENKTNRPYKTENFLRESMLNLFCACLSTLSNAALNSIYKQTTFCYPNLRR